MRLYRGSVGDWIQVDEASVLGAGGEGRVYGVIGTPDLAAKLYDDGRRSDREEKLRAMLGNAPARHEGDHTSIAWPEDLLAEAPGGPVIGYLMARVRHGRVIDDYYNPQARLEHCPLFHYEYLLVVARNLASAVRSLHQRGYVIGDVKQSNILVTPNALVTLVDTDSFQVRDEACGKIYRCPVGTPEYTPPELQGLAAPGLLTPEHDLFGLGVLIFQLLMEGAHPFAGAYMGEDDPPPLGDRIRMGWFPYDRSAMAATSGTTFRRQRDMLAPPFVPARKALPFAVLPAEIQGHFVRCFAFGHHESTLRPTADEWLQALDRARSSLVRCSANGQHRYPSHLAACPWCDRMRTVLRGHDPYPAPNAIPRPVMLPAPSFPTRAPSIPPLPPPPYGRMHAGKTRSGWTAYAIAALGLPIFLGLLSSREVTDPSPPQRIMQSQPYPTTPPASAPDPTPQAQPSAPAQQGDESKSASQTTGTQGSISPVYSNQGSITSDGRFAAIVTEPIRVSVLDCRSGRILGSTPASYEGVTINSMAIAPSGMLLAVTNGHGIRVWDRLSARTRLLIRDQAGISAVAFSPNGKFLAVAHDQSDLSVMLLDVQTGDVVRSCEGEPLAPVTSLDFSTDGRSLFGTSLGGRDNRATLTCWKAATGELMWTDYEKVWNGRLAVSPDGKMLAVAGWDVDQHCAFIDQRHTADGDEQSRQMITDLYRDVKPLCYSQDGGLLAVTDQHTIHISRSQDASSFRIWADHVVSAAFSADGARLTTLSTTNGVEDWDLRTKRRVRRIALPGH